MNDFCMARKPSDIRTAAGILFTGYGGMWSISDETGHSAARRKISQHCVVSTIGFRSSMWVF
ncbi:hypothetical protein L210DRAFT_3546462 [Boletus edulis BED1]|uniref:Uncharacterized protein n=1 Tax=Boletus edulis BED1 TaxID=1328754 RepID=A0AAD4BRM8_BOLED|nr:hypothetical protein L210DRAFT_3546462 [Boletus edulis BED1]